MSAIDSITSTSPKRSSPPTSSLNPFTEKKISKRDLNKHAQALYTYKATQGNEEELSFIRGELLLIKEIEGLWWRARKEDGTQGVALSLYLQIVPEVFVISGQINRPPPLSDDGRTVSLKAKALFDYDAEGNDPCELSFKKGDTIEVMDTDGHWLPSRKTHGTVGIIYSDRLYIVTNFSQKAQALYNHTANPEFPKEIDLRKGEIIDISPNDTSKWWPARKADGSVGDVPSNCVKVLPGETAMGRNSVDGSIKSPEKKQQSLLPSLTGLQPHLSVSTAPESELREQETSIERMDESNLASPTGNLKSSERKMVKYGSRANTSTFLKAGLDVQNSVDDDPDDWNRSVSETAPPLLISEFRYKGRAIYAYKADPTDPNELSFAKGDILDIQDTEGNWWIARNKAGKTGMAPSNYIQVIPEEVDEVDEDKITVDVLIDWFLDQPASQAPEGNERELSSERDDETNDMSSQNSIRGRNADIDDFFNFDIDIEAVSPLPMASHHTPDVKDQLTKKHDKPGKDKALPSTGLDGLLPDVNVSGTGAGFHDVASAARTQTRELIAQDDEYSSSSESEESQPGGRNGRTKGRRHSAKDKRILDGMNIVKKPRKMWLWCL